MSALSRYLKTWHRDTQAAAKVEYAVLILLIGMAAITGLSFLGDAMSDQFETLGVSMAEGTHSGHADTEDIHPAAEANAAKPIHQTLANSAHAGRFLVLVFCLALFCLMVVRIRQHSADEKADDELRNQSREEIPVILVFQKRHQILNALFKDVESLFDLEVRVGQVMTTQMACVLPKTPVQQLKKIVSEEKKRHLLVVDKAGKLLGVVSDRDLLGRCGMTAECIMTKDPLTVDENSPLDPAVTIMIRNSIHCLPVTKEGKLVGLLTSTDVMLSLQCISQALQRLSGDELKQRRFAPNELDTMEGELENFMCQAAGV